MGAKTDISWTDSTWSPLRARVKQDAAEIARAKGYTSLIQIAGKMAGHVGPHCERVSHGCDHCYSDTNNGRCLPANGTGLPFDRRARDLIVPYIDEKILALPLHWRKAKRIFVENQSDLFGEWVTDDMIDHVLVVMSLCSQHSFQVLTKRPYEVLRYLQDPAALRDRLAGLITDPRFLGNWGDLRRLVLRNPSRAGVAEGIRKGWRSPLPNNVWIGVSAEDQKTWDERTEILEQVPAAIRFVSLEPQLAYVDVGPVLKRGNIRWLVQGGESGPGARPFNTGWAHTAKAECYRQHVAYFLKQYGARPTCDHNGTCYGKEGLLCDWPRGHEIKLKDRKGGNPAEWHPDLREQNFPEVKA